jgi:hypothetical protein
MRATSLGVILVAALAVHSTIAEAQTPPPPAPAVAPPPPPPEPATPPPPAPAAGAGTTPAAGSPSAGAAAGADFQLPPPAAGTGAPGPGTGVAAGASLTGSPNATELGPSQGDEWRFSFHGYTRAPMRIGFGSRPQCPAGTATGTSLTPSGGMPMAGQAQIPCAGPGQSTSALHTPMVPDSQYLDWRYDRQQEYDWTELFFNYGNSLVTATVAIDAFGFTDAEYIAYNNVATQLGIAQGFLTIHPDFGIPTFRMEAKIGSFWDKYGMAGEYDAGKYDTYMFGRTHQMGERIRLEYDVGDVTFNVAHGIGTRAEQVAFNPLQAGVPTFPAGNETNLPGFTLLNHLHAGLAYKKVLSVNAHYLSSWAQDYRAVGAFPGTDTDGHIDVTGVEATVRPPGGIGGRLYAAYSHILATNPQVVGPAIEAVHSLGGGNYESGNGILDNFLGCYLPPGGMAGPANSFGGFCETTQNSIGATHGTVDTVEVQYDYSFGALYRKLTTGEGFWGGGWDVNLSLFGMYSAVNSSLKTTDTGTLLLGDGVKKLKWGADLVIAPLPWLGFGVRGDFVQPTNYDSNQNFSVISPKIIFHTKWVTHEEITAWYSHYTYGSAVLPQPPNGITNPNTMGSPGPFPPDKDVVGVKGTFWW